MLGSDLLQGRLRVRAEEEVEAGAVEDEAGRLWFDGLAQRSDPVFRVSETVVTAESTNVGYVRFCIEAGSMTTDELNITSVRGEQALSGDERD